MPCHRVLLCCKSMPEEFPLLRYTKTKGHNNSRQFFSKMALAPNRPRPTKMTEYSGLDTVRIRTKPVWSMASHPQFTQALNLQPGAVRICRFRRLASWTYSAYERGSLGPAMAQLNARARDSLGTRRWRLAAARASLQVSASQASPLVILCFQVGGRLQDRHRDR